MYVWNRDLSLTGRLALSFSELGGDCKSFAIEEIFHRTERL
jgi:hypothetical protein